ncbi:RecB family exonuclease [Knoellia subterranea KCTC 19937]|uniref:RecB family exonuclease n=1 Tax=Knoellia subterranea KCTC 19937 TaxID=1385521 RepID=A0A0A0JRT1_9MICO|nr:RecB family exonuclease [Knoellia subterranea KCTC 19937]
MSDVGTGRPVQQEFAGMPPKLYAASPSRLLALVDCPRRYRMQYLDKPRPEARAQRAHTSFGLAVHNALRDWWDLPRDRRTASAGRELVRHSWIDVGFRDADQSLAWRKRAQEHVVDYLGRVDPDDPPRGIERTVSFISGTLRLTGRIDRLDERDRELVVVDYKTSQRPLGEDDARTSLPLALYAAAVWKMFRHPCLRVELHHVPSGEIVSHTHTPESLTRKVDEAKSIAQDARRADADFAERGVESTLFPPVVGPLCTWCDFRAHCPEGQTAGPEKSGWAALEPSEVPRAAEVD